jgi:hypothetical protein
MDQKHRLVGRVIKAEDDLLHQDVDQTLLGARIGRRRVPSRRQVVRKLEELGTIDRRLRRRSGPQAVTFLLQLAHPLQCTVPAGFQLAGHMAFSRIHQFVPTCGERGLIARRLQLTLERRSNLLA